MYFLDKDYSAIQYGSKDHEQIDIQFIGEHTVFKRWIFHLFSNFKYKGQLI